MAIVMNARGRVYGISMRTDTRAQVDEAVLIFGLTDENLLLTGTEAP